MRSRSRWRRLRSRERSWPRAGSDQTVGSASFCSTFASESLRAASSKVTSNVLNPSFDGAIPLEQFLHQLYLLLSRKCSATSATAKTNVTTAIDRGKR